MNLSFTLLDPRRPDWPAAVEQICAGLGAPANPALFPSHFLGSTFARIGGRLAVAARDGRLAGAAFLFPRAIEDGQPVYTLRPHLAPGGEEQGGVSLPETSFSSHPGLLWQATAEFDITVDGLARAVAAMVAPARVVLHDPAVTQVYAPSHRLAGDLDIGAPDAVEAEAARNLQQIIWRGAPGSLYPADLYTPAFRPGTGLVARQGGRVLAFLFGFFRFGGLPDLARLGTGHRTDLAIESQVLAIDPGVRRGGLAARLKWLQAEAARAEGINVIHWTADPLQFANAALNFGKLRAVAYSCYPAYYAFSNELNRVGASRFGMVWLLDSERVRAAASGRPGTVDLGVFAGVRVLNAGPDELAEPDGAPAVAFEIPADWTALQRDAPDRAAAWRATSDRLFTAYLGLEQGRYLVTDAAIAGERRYLVALRFDPLIFANGRA